MGTFKVPRLVRRGVGWQLYYYRPGGERRRLSVGSDLQQAQRLLVRFTDWLLDGKDPEVEVAQAQTRAAESRMTLREFFPVFMKRHGAHTSTNMQKSYQCSFRNISRCPVLADAELSSVSKDAVLDYMSARIEQDGICPASANVEAMFLKCMLSRASDWGLVEDNPLRGMKLLPAKSKRDVELTQEEAKALIGLLAEPMASIVEFAIYSGFRKENILSLRIESVRLHDLTPTGEVELVVKGGRREVFPLAPVAVEVLKRVIAGRRNGYVFVNPETGSRYQCINQSFDRAVRKLGLMACDGTKLRLHDLRHVFATWLHREGVSLDALRSLLGHRDRATTDRYASVNRLEVGKLLALMPSLREARQERPVVLRRSEGWGAPTDTN